MRFQGVLQISDTLFMGNNKCDINKFHLNHEYSIELRKSLYFNISFGILRDFE